MNNKEKRINPMRGQFIKNTVICLIIGAIFGQPTFLFEKEINVTSASGIPNQSGIFFVQIFPWDESLKDDSTDQIEQSTASQPEDVITLPEVVAPVEAASVTKKPTPPPVAPKKTHCPAKKDRPGWSSRNDKNHMDEDCCADYDEWPKAGCAYSAKDFALMLKGPTNGHKRHK